MTVRSAFWRWFILGSIAASLLLFAQSGAVGGVAGLLQVGETSNLRPLIEEQLGNIPLAAGPGHDGQIFYAIALDLWGAEVPELLDHGAYRYRRILYPFVAAFGGLLKGWPLLYSMIAISIVSIGIAAGTVAAMATKAGRSDWMALVVLLNPGVWLSVRLLTSDSVALAAMVAALALLTTRFGWAVGLFSVSGLAKDVYLATPGGLAVTKDRRRWLLIAVPLIVLAIWMLWLTFTMGEGFTGRGNLSLPFVGIVEGAANWSNLDVEEWVYLSFALASGAAGLFVAATRSSWLRWPILAWTTLAVLSSNWVWDFGNNAARAFAPIVVLVSLSYLPEEVTMAEERVSTTSVEG